MFTEETCICQAMEKTMKADEKKFRFLIDGFPRNQENLQGWTSVMDGKAEVKFVLFFDCSNEVRTREQLRVKSVLYWFIGHHYRWLKWHMIIEISFRMNNEHIFGVFVSNRGVTVYKHDGFSVTVQ